MGSFLGKTGKNRHPKEEHCRCPSESGFPKLRRREDE